MSFTTQVKLFLTRPRILLNSLLLFLFFALWLRDFFYWLPKDAFETSLNYWAFTDWLIDYSQGFIRRGLSGEIWRLVPTMVPPLEFIAVFSWILISMVAFGYLRLLARSREIYHPLTLFGMLFLPSLLIFYLHDHNAIARKEILGYVTLLLHLLVVEKTFPSRAGCALRDGNQQRYMWWMVPIAGIVLPAIILIHEGNFLLFIPLHGIITLTILRMKPGSTFARAALWTGLLYLPAALAFGAVYLAGTPNYQMLLGICKKWLATGAIREGTCFLPPERLSGSTLPGSLIPMGWSLPKAVQITQFFILQNWKAWIVILPTCIILLWYLVRQAVYSILRIRCPQAFSPRTAQRYTGLFFRKFFVIPLLFSLPIYFTAYDYGRWFTVTSLNYSLVAVSMNLLCWEFTQSVRGAGEGSVAASSQEHLDHRLVFYSVSILICFLALVLWLPHYCLFSCEIIRSPLEFLTHTFIPR